MIDRELISAGMRVNAAHGYARSVAIREFYKIAEPEILAAGRVEWGIDPYMVNWSLIFTPIEAALWADIREAGAVLYPQYPVGRFFVDFGNPIAKVAIECDGARWHTDAGKDAARTKEIEALGWQVYRISGRDCKTEFDEETREISAARQFVDRVAAARRIVRFGSETAMPINLQDGISW